MRRGIEEVFGVLPVAHPPLVLAPMAGYTNGAMRMMSYAFGAAFSYTEMVSGRGLLHASDKTWQLLESLPTEGALAAHLYGAEPEVMASAAARVAATGKFRAIDLNAGCPVKKITVSGSGAALVEQPELLHRILAAMRSAVTLPLTVKTRLGARPDRVAIFELLDAAERAGADALALHARFTAQGHGGPTNLDLLAEVKARAHIPIIGNGGVTSPYTAWQMWRRTGVDALMIGRAAIGNPWIFGEIAQALANGEVPPPERYVGERPPRPLAEIGDALKKHLQLEQRLIRQQQRHGYLSTTEGVEESLISTTFRCHLFRYLHGLKGSSYLRGHLRELRTLQQILGAVEECFEREAAWRTKKMKK